MGALRDQTKVNIRERVGGRNHRYQPDLMSGFHLFLEVIGIGDNLLELLHYSPRLQNATDNTVSEERLKAMAKRSGSCEKGS